MQDTLLKSVIRATEVNKPEGITINPIGKTTLIKIIKGDHRLSNQWILTRGLRGGINNHFMIHQISHALRMEYIDKVSSPTGSMIPIIVPQTHKRGEPTSQIIRDSKVLVK